MNRDGSRQWRPRIPGYPAWSPDGRRMVFYDPKWSPDGRKILFSTERDGNFEIYVMNADGSGQTNLTRSPGDDFCPGWIPVARSFRC